MVSIRDMPTYIWAFVLAGIFAGVGVLVITEFENTLTTGTQTDVTKNATLGIANIAAQLPTVGTIVGVSLIVGVVVLLFVAFKGQGSTY